MSEVWSKVYKSDSTFFGEEPSNFTLLCCNHMKTNNVKKVLELGAGHGRDTTLFASKGSEVEALDYSVTAIEILDKIANEKGYQSNHESLMSRSRFHFEIDILMLYIHTCFLT